MRDTKELTEEEMGSYSDHDKSFERTHGSFIACINRSLDNAFEFLSETGYASAGLSDNERVDSRNSHLDRSRHDVNLKEPMPDNERIDTTDEHVLHERKDSYQKKSYQNERLNHTGEDRGNQCLTKNYSSGSPSNIDEGLKEPTVCEVFYFNEKPFCVDEEGSSKKKSKHGRFEDVGMHASNGDLATKIVNENKQISKQGAQKCRNDDDKNHAGNISKNKTINAKETNHVHDGPKKLNKNGQHESSDLGNREISSYLTSEREIFKKILDNARQSEQVNNAKRRNSKCYNNQNAGHSPSKTSPAKSPSKGKDPRHKGFKKFRESFRRKSNFFLPHKLVVQEDKDGNSDVINALEFQYYRMEVSRDTKQAEKHAKVDNEKKKGFLKQLFDRDKNKTRRKSWFRSTEMLHQNRSQSRENLFRKSDRPKSISLFIDKIRDQFEQLDRSGSMKSLMNIAADEEMNVNRRKNSFKGSRFRRSESLRSITSAARYSILSDALKRGKEDADTCSIQMQSSRENQSIGTRDVLQRSYSIDVFRNNEQFDSIKLQRVLKNRFSCFPMDDHIFDLQSHNADNHSAFISSSSPRKNDDITEWIRGLQYSSKVVEEKKRSGVTKGDNNTANKEKDRLIEICETKDYMKFFQQTRLVNGQIQTYL